MQMVEMGDSLDQGLIGQEQHDALREAGQQIVNVLGDSPLTLKDLYITPRADLPEGLWEPTERMVAAGLDLPFCNQPDEKKAEAQEVFELGYLNDSVVSEGRPGVGDLTEWDFYNRKATDYLKVHWMIQRAKVAHIMRSTTATRGTTNGTSKANDLACVNGVECREYPDLFCSVVDGQCTLASDPWPG